MLNATVGVRQFTLLLRGEGFVRGSVMHALCMGMAAAEG